jgi:hypothetical protein
MNMKKSSIVSILILFGLLVALSGCVQQVEEAKTLGTEGLVISFEQGAPPVSIDKNEPFDIGVLMENKGTADILEGDAAVWISGIVYDSYDGITEGDAKQSNRIDLEGAYFEGDQPVPGDADVAQWTGLKYLPTITSGKHPAIITAKSCYKYSTIARAPMCLATRSAIRDTTGTAICEIDEEKPASNDAGPVQVTKVTEYTSGSDGVKAVIEIQNVGNGDVYDNALDTDCLSAQRSDLDKIYVNYVKLGTIEFDSKECTWIPEGTGKNKKHYIKLQEGIKILTCTKGGIAGVGISQESMSINISYGYTETIKTNMDINAI